MFIEPDWPAPKHIKACCTTREGGVSQPPYNQFNLALHVGDEVEHVLQNRQRLHNFLALPAEPFWLDQQHTDIVVHHACREQHSARLATVADASWTDIEHSVCAVMTADCLPILLTNQAGSVVSAIHAGWKGLQKGIVTNTLQQIARKGILMSDMMAWIGPAISQRNFEVGQDVYDAFVMADVSNSAFFQSQKSVNQADDTEAKYLADLVGLAKKELHMLGVENIYGGDYCSYQEEHKFFSYRRDGDTGRMASLIWMER